MLAVSYTVAVPVCARLTFFTSEFLGSRAACARKKERCTLQGRLRFSIDMFCSLCKTVFILVCEQAGAGCAVPSGSEKPKTASATARICFARCNEQQMVEGVRRLNFSIRALLESKGVSATNIEQWAPQWSA